MTRQKTGRNSPCPCGSGKKFKRCCLKQRQDQPEATLFLSNYHQLVFSFYEKTAGSLAQLKEMDCEALLRRILTPLAPPSRFRSDTSIDILKVVSAYLETRISEIASRHHIYYWLHLYRRLAPDNKAFNIGPGSMMLSREILECAFQKYGATDIGDDLVLGETIDPKIVMNGDYLKALEHFGLAPASWGRKTLSGVFIRKFSVDGLVQLISLERLAVEFNYVAACIRRANKGGELVVRTNSMYFVENNSETERLMQSYDNRCSRLSGQSTSTGVPVDYIRVSPERAHNVIFAPIYNVNRLPISELGQDKLWHGDAKYVNANDFAPNFIWLPFDMESYYSRHKFMSAEFEAQRGVSLETFVSCICMIWQMAYLNGRDNPSKTYEFMQRAYSHFTSLDGLVESLVNATGSWQLDFMHGYQLTEDQARSLLKVLTLSPATSSRIGLVTRGPRSLVIPTWDDGCLLDYAAVVPILLTAMHDIEVDWTPKGPEFEKHVKQFLSSKGCALWEAQKTLVAEDGTKNEIDLSFAVGPLLYVCELRSIGRSSAFERGDLAALEYRRRKIDSAISDADDLATWLAAHPRGRNYALPDSVSKVAAVAVFPHVEYIWSEASDLWLTDAIPRCCTPEELPDLNEATVSKSIEDRTFVHQVR